MGVVLVLFDSLLYNEIQYNMVLSYTKENGFLRSLFDRVFFVKIHWLEMGVIFIALKITELLDTNFILSTREWRLVGEQKHG